MYKPILKQIILKNQARIQEVKVYKREYTFEKQANYVIVGSRRAGKTYVLFQIIQEMLKVDSVEEILYINFEDERLIELNHKDLNQILEAYSELYKHKPKLFFDEIQNVKHWEKFTRRLADEGYKIHITGSNSQMLSTQIASTLGGRFIVKEVLPLSFKEFLQFNDFVLEKNYEFSSQLVQVKKHFATYFKYGGFPEIIKFDDKRTYLSNLFQKLLYGDIIARYQVKNDKALLLLAKKIAESVNNETSVNRIKNLIKSIGIPIGTATIFDYLEYFNESYLIFPIVNYINKFVEKETKKKYYFLDNGILMLFLHNQDTKLLENLVFVGLKRRFDEIYYYKRNYETDFYIPKEDLLIQVSYDMSDIETEQRELKALQKSKNELNCKNAIIITYDTNKELLLDGKTIKVISAWKWLLSE